MRLARLNTLNLDTNPSVVVGVSLDGLAEVSYGTRAHWESVPAFVPAPGQIVVWTDRGKTTDDHGNEVDVPGFKVGDGNAYNLDLPFVGDDVAERLEGLITAHAGNSSIHVSEEDRQNWDNKITCLDEVVNETLVLTR